MVFFLAFLIAWPGARPALASTHTWTGATSTSWSDSSNWTGGSPAGDPYADLVFPATPVQLHSTDDINGVSYVNSITFVGSGYNVDALAGCSMALAGGLTWSGVSVITGANSLAIPIALYGGSTHVFITDKSADATAKFYLSGLISGGGSETLVFTASSNPSGTFVLTQDNTFSGPTNIFAGGDCCSVNVTINGHQAASALGVYGRCVLAGSGQIGPLHLTTSNSRYGPAFVQPGDATTGVLSVAGDVVFPPLQAVYSAYLKLRINGPNAGIDYDQLFVDGNVSLFGAEIQVSLGFQPTVGQAFTVIKSTGQITGSFRGVWGGQIILPGCTTFQIGYTQNEVTLTRIVAPPPPPITSVTIQAVGTRTVCPTSLGGVVSVTDTGGGGTCDPADSHQWGYRLVSGGAISNINGQIGTTYTINGADFLGPGTYFLVCMSAPTGGASVTSNELQITVVPPPTAQASGGGTICTGTSIQLSGSGASSCTWLPVAGLSDPNSCTPLASPSTSTEYSLVVTGAGGCVSTNTATASVVNAKPATPVVTAPATAFAGHARLAASVESHAGASYQWSVTNGSITSGQGTSQITFAAGSSGSVSLTVIETSAAGCASAQASVSIPLTVTATRMYTATQCRLFDTRNSTGADAASPALAAGETRIFTIGERCSLPASAKAISVNQTVTGQTADGDLVLYRGDLSSAPGTSSIIYAAGKTRANNGILELARDGSGTFKVFNNSPGMVDFILDVNGYFQ
jgi:hypothetical protein